MIRSEKYKEIQSIWEMVKVQRTDGEVLSKSLTYEEEK